MHDLDDVAGVELAFGMARARHDLAIDLDRDAVLVICDGDLVPGDATLAADAAIEIRPVISGG